MSNKLLEIMKNKPEVYEAGHPKFWDDAHISQSMLGAHLNPELDSATRKHAFVNRSAEWIAKTANPSVRPLLLDLGCGPGIYANLFAQQGFLVTGIDLSPFSIAYAKQHGVVNTQFICGDYLNISFDRAFDVVTLIYCDFGVLAPHHRSALLKKIYGALNESGLLIVDVCSPVQYSGWDEKNEWSYCQDGFWSPNPYACLYAFYRYDDCRTYNQQYIIVEEDDIRCFNIWNHAFMPEELQTDLTTAGFTDVQLFDNVAGEPYTGQSEAICAVAKK